jgi:hypothetical protein
MDNVLNCDSYMSLELFQMRTSWEAIVVKVKHTAKAYGDRGVKAKGITLPKTMRSLAGNTYYSDLHVKLPQQEMGLNADKGSNHSWITNH